MHAVFHNGQAIVCRHAGRNLIFGKGIVKLAELHFTLFDAILIVYGPNVVFAAFVENIVAWQPNSGLHVFGLIRLHVNVLTEHETFEIIEHKVEVILCRLCKRAFGTVGNTAVVIIVCGFAFNALHGARPSLLRVYAGDDLHFHALLQGIDIQLRCRAFYTVRTRRENRNIRVRRIAAACVGIGTVIDLLHNAGHFCYDIRIFKRFFEVLDLFRLRRLIVFRRFHFKLRRLNL